MSKTFHQPRKRFGQNFLVDEQIIANIISAIAPQSGDKIVEIGPGLGALTTRLLPIVNELTVIEIDRDIIPKLTQLCAGMGELTIYNEDVLGFDFTKLFQPAEKLKIVGNLPYNISTPLLFHLTNYTACISEMVFMLQKEVVERICAPVGCKAYGRLSVMMSYFFQRQYLLDVPATAFNPAPKVESAVVRLIPHQQPTYSVSNVELLSKVVAEAFSMRRKTIRNSLKKTISAEELEKLGINPQQRPEQLALADYVKLTNYLSG